MKSIVRGIVSLTCMALISVAAAFGQVGTGTPPFGSFSGSSFDTVNNASLNVHLQIPIVSKAGRGMPFYYMLGYDSSLWSPQYVNGHQAWVPATGWGWSGITDDSTGYVQSESSFVQNQCFYNSEYYDYSYTQYYGFTYIDPSGTSHWFPMSLSTSPEPTPPNGCEPPPPGNGIPSGTAQASDGSGYTLSVNLSDFSAPATITDVSGKVIIPPVDSTVVAASVTDPNGNKLSASISGGTTTFTDTLDTTALSVSASNPLTYSYSNPLGGTSRVTVNYSTYTVQTDFACSSISEFGPTSESLIHTITLADGTSYTFNYEQTPNFPNSVTGRISSITLLTGGKISYAYTASGINNDGINCTSGSGAYLARTTPDGEWKYSVTGSAPSVTTVTDPQGNQTVYNFEGIYQTEQQIYQGLSSSGTLLSTITTCYNGNTTNCPGTAVNTPITSVTVTTQTDNGLQSKTVTSYNGYGLPTEVDEYGYGSGGTPGGLYRKTLTSYDTALGNIQDRPSEVQVENGSGGLAAETTYGYDGNGNLTSLNEYFTPSSYLTRSFTYGSYGVLASATDFNGNATTFTNGDCSGAFPTQVNQPLSLSSLMAWNCNTGLVTSVTDPNSQTTSFSYDELDRVTQTNYPDGGEVSTAYNDTSSPVSVATTTVLGAPGNRTDTATLDGLGRVTETALTSDPAGADKVDTTYNSLGRVASVSNPYRSSSTGGDSYAYDALGRVTSVTHADSNATHSYYGSAVGGAGGNMSQRCWSPGSGYPRLFSDEDGNLRETWTDSVGRIIEVDEPDPANGSMTDSNALSTCYLYDLLNDLTTVVQGQQNRTYTYDMLSRLTSSATPESGTTTYSYSGCSGDPSNVCTRTDARGITTTYGYDALNRLTSKSYSDGTPVANFWYDSASACFGGSGGWCLWNQLTNTKGRLSATCTSNAVASCNSTSTGTVYSYDPLGRVTHYWQCTPYNCGSSAWQMTYNYDLAGDVTSWTHPAGFTITNFINKAQQITAISSSLVDSTHPQYLAKNITYTPWGAESTLENGCASSSGQEMGCTDTVETYTYNNRLQPVEIELGTTTNAAADYCLVYNFYAGVGNPTGCAAPSQGAGDNGNVMGIYDQDNANASLSHAEAYTYDALSRLTNAVATGNAAYNFTLQYDRYGNMTCTINGQTNGPCPEYSFNSASNQITNTGYTYDAAGNLTSDGTNIYQYDAEQRLVSVNSGSTISVGYFASGLQASWTPGGSNPLYFLRNPSGVAVEVTQQAGWYDPRVPFGIDRSVSYSNGQTTFYGTNAIGSWTMSTNYAGSVSSDVLFYPWGQNWNSPSGGAVFAGLPERDDGLSWSVGFYRHYNYNLGRWLTPDLLGGDITNPQSLNRYAYALNNPTTLTDPSGLGPCPSINGMPTICITSTADGDGDGNTPPGLGGGIGECPFYGCVPNCSIFTCGPMPGQREGSGAGSGGGGAPAPKPSRPANTPAAPSNPMKTCTVNAHGVTNNLPSRAPNRPGAFGVPETPGTAAIDRSQWLPAGSSGWTPAQDNAYINQFRNQISGYIPNGNSGYVRVFNGVSDTMGPASGVKLLENAYPGRVLFELPGGPNLENVNGMHFQIPSAMGCPNSNQE